MKAFNIQTVLIALFVGGLLLTSCENEATSNNPNDSTTLDNNEGFTSPIHKEDVDVSPINRAELDSMRNNIENLKKQIGESSNCADKFENEIKNLQEQESGNKLYLLISLVLCIVSLVIAVVALAKASKFNNRLDKYGNDIDNLRQSADSRVAPTPRQNGSDDYYHLKLKLSSLENEVNALKRTDNTLDNNRPYTPKPTPVPGVKTKKGYFGQPTQTDRGYFKSFLTAQDSEARFSAEEKNNVATFEPLLNTRAERGTLLHTDAAKLAVDFEGCSLQEANQAEVIKPGEAKLEGNRWYITKKAIVFLSR